MARFMQVIKQPFTLEGMVNGLVWSLLPGGLSWLATGAASLILGLEMPVVLPLGLGAMLVATAAALYVYDRFRKPVVLREAPTVPQTATPHVVPPAPERLVHNADCWQAAIKLKAHGDLASGEWDRITYCATCGAELVDDYSIRSREEGVPNWSVRHEQSDLFDQGLPGVWLYVKALGELHERIFKCEVEMSGWWVPAVADLADQGQGFKSQERSERLANLPPLSEESVLFPDRTEFSNAPDLPLRNGEYHVRWWALGNGTAERLLKTDFFEYRGGTLVR